MAKILIIEDDKVYASTIKQALECEGFAVTIAEDGVDGFDKVMQEKPDLVLVDILLPKVDGIAMVKKMKDAKISIPVIFLTNMSDFRHMSEAIEAAQTDYLIKSNFSLKEIVEKVKRKLEQKA